MSEKERVPTHCNQCDHSKRSIRAVLLIFGELKRLQVVIRVVDINTNHYQAQVFYEDCDQDVNQRYHDDLDIAVNGFILELSGIRLQYA